MHLPNKSKGFTTFSLHERGFTLVELLVVISIIAILSVIGITIFTGAQKSARDAKRKGDVTAISTAMEIYKTTTGLYPCAGGPCTSPGSFGWAPTSSLATTLKPNYIADVPSDPSGDPCGYLVMTDGYKFSVLTTLENSNDPSANLVKGAPVTSPSGSTFSADKKTFTVGAGSCVGVTYNHWINNQQ